MSTTFHLIRQNRLVAGVTSFSEVSDKVKQALLTIPERTALRTTYEDAEILTKDEGLIPRTIAYNGFIEEAMGAGE